MPTPKVNLIAPNTNRLRCPACHRFLGTVGANHLVDQRCGVRYVLTMDGTYTTVAA
jgi:hypothetical protein